MIKFYKWYERTLTGNQTQYFVLTPIVETMGRPNHQLSFILYPHEEERAAMFGAFSIRTLDRRLTHTTLNKQDEAYTRLGVLLGKEIIRKIFTRY